MQADDSRLSVLADLARALELPTVVDAPLSGEGAKPSLGAVVLSTEGSISTYYKMDLGGNESLYFDPGQKPKVLPCAERKVGLVICTDTSCCFHPGSCIVLGADVNAASVFLTKEWFDADSPRLQVYAKR